MKLFMKFCMNIWGIFDEKKLLRLFSWKTLFMKFHENIHHFMEWFSPRNTRPLVLASRSHLLPHVSSSRQTIQHSIKGRKVTIASTPLVCFIRFSLFDQCISIVGYHSSSRCSKLGCSGYVDDCIHTTGLFYSLFSNFEQCITVVGKHTVADVVNWVALDMYINSTDLFYSPFL
jgi:hypothetical protein